MRTLFLFLLLGTPVLRAQTEFHLERPERSGLDPAPLLEIPGILSEALKEGRIPGVVCQVAKEGRTVLRLAQGRASVIPEAVPMPMDAVFDLASLTKVVATTSAVMLLVQDGRLDLDDRIAEHLPRFAPNGKDAITVEMLLRHRGGLLPDNALADYRDGPERAWERICALGLRAPPPGSKYIYTDVGMITLGRLVEKLSGRPLDRFCRERIFRKLGMEETGFVRRGEPAPLWLARAVPTEPAEKGDPPLRGVVHDPRARLLEGVAGHAGLFSTAADLTRFAQVLLAGGAPLFEEETVKAMLLVPPSLPARERRGLGWDRRPPGIFSSHAAGSLLPATGFGHTGFTGTSMWLDPASRTSIVILCSRLHPDGSGRIGTLRARVADAVARSLGHRGAAGQGTEEDG